MFTQILRIEVRSLCLQDKHISNGAVSFPSSPSPQFSFCLPWWTHCWRNQHATPMDKDYCVSLLTLCRKSESGQRPRRQQSSKTANLSTIVTLLQPNSIRQSPHPVCQQRHSLAVTFAHLQLDTVSLKKKSVCSGILALLWNN